MMNILLSLLSDQHVPNLLAVHHYEPDHLVLVASVQMERKREADHLLAALKQGGLDYDSRCHVQPLSVEGDLARIRAALQEAYGLFPASRLIANVNGWYEANEHRSLRLLQGSWRQDGLHYLEPA